MVDCKETLPSLSALETGHAAAIQAATDQREGSSLDVRQLETGTMAISVKRQIDTNMAKWLKMAILALLPVSETKSYPAQSKTVIFVLDAFRVKTGHSMTGLVWPVLTVLDWPRVPWFIRG